LKYQDEYWAEIEFDGDKSENDINEIMDLSIPETQNQI